ncbi:MAG: serine protease [Bacteroides sp. SM23_62]|nr:MAG: serine protease [Bacteroides sp. SM23_62]
MKRTNSKISVYLLVLLATLLLSAQQTGNRTEDQQDTTLVYVFEIKENIAPPAWRLTQRAFEEAAEIHADLIIIHLNTYGGMLDAADSIRTKILNSDIPVWVFIDNNAASAGALISIACDSIYMRPGGSIGAATVVNQTGEVVPDKFQSFMRSTMRATAEAHGRDTVISGNDTIISWHRDPRIAEAMVDPSIYIEGISDTGKVLTFTTEEAIQHGFCEGPAKTVEEVLEAADVGTARIVRHKATGLDKIIGFLLNPVISGILIMILVGGIYFELQSPGIGFPLAAAVVAAILYFAPLYLEGLAENWELVIFIVGLLLIAVEIFAIPGFGVAGIAGIILVIAGLTLAMVDNIVFELEWNIAFAEVIKRFFIVITSMFLSLILSLWLGKQLFTAKAFAGLALDRNLDVEEGFLGVESKQKDLVGRTGIVESILRPAGKVVIDDEIYDAVSEYGFINKGEKVKVTRYETGQIYVIKVNEES